MLTNTIRFLLHLWIRIPFGYICRVHHKDSHMTLRKDYWVVMTNGKTSRTLPITLLSHHLQHEFALSMKKIGYDVDVFFDKNAYANVKPLDEINIKAHAGQSESLLVDERATIHTTKRNP